MRRTSIVIIIIITSLLSCRLGKVADNPEKKIVLETEIGDIIIKLYPETPVHSTNFENLASKGVFDGVLFHRVISNFMIQTGDPNTRTTPLDFDVNYRLYPEFNSNLFHKKGSVAAAREGDNVNPQKLSSGTQFYIVVGKKFSASELDNITKNRNENKKRELFNSLVMDRANQIIDAGGTPDFSVIPIEIQKLFSSIWDTTPKYSINEYQQELYTTEGGSPHLDGDYTVFGEVV